MWLLTCKQSLQQCRASSLRTPIPEECGGFIAPYNPDIYSKKWAEACDTGNMHYQCGINFLCQKCVASALPGVPMYKQRIE